MKKDILIFPYSGTAKEALDCLGESYNCIGFISDDQNFIGKEYSGIRIFDRRAFSLFPDALVLAVPGSPKSFLKRKEIIDGLSINETRLATVIHPKAFVSKNAAIGKNVLIMAFVNIGPEVVIGNHICILPNSTVHHDTIINDYSLVAGNVLIAGNVTIGTNCYLGAGSNIINGCVIEERCLVGIGSTVIRNIKNNSTVVGNPAKNIEK